MITFSVPWRSAARLSALTFASVAWTISSGTGIFRNRTKNKAGKRGNNREQYFPDSGNQPGTAAEEATGGRTRPAQEKKPGFGMGM